MSVSTAERFSEEEPREPNFKADDTGGLRFDLTIRQLTDLAWHGIARESEHPDGVPDLAEWWNTMPLDARGDLPDPYGQMADDREQWETNGAATVHFDHDEPEDPRAN